MREPLKPNPDLDDFQTAASEKAVEILLAFRDDDSFAEDIELNIE